MSSILNHKQLHRVIDGRINAETAALEGNEPAWTSLVQSLLPHTLPAQADECLRLFQTRFRGCVPQGVTQAAATLSALCFEQQARALLVDFLREHRDSLRLYKLLRMQLLFWERTEGVKKQVASTSVTGHQTEAQLTTETDLDWDWTPSEEGFKAPDVDDSPLRAGAAQLQESISSYRAKESGTRLTELEDLADGDTWQVAPILANDHDNNESLLLKRTAKLGQTALDLLRYFADNPGDRAVHAEGVLGYPTSEINRLLLGSLGYYLKRSDYGGWECNPWVIELLSALDQTREKG